MAKKVPANNEDKKRSYYKFYLQDCAAGDPERHKLIDAGPGDPANALHIDNRNDLFLPGDLPGEFGWFQMSDGTGLIANKTFSPAWTASCSTGGLPGIPFTVCVTPAGITRITTTSIWTIPPRRWI